MSKRLVRWVQRLQIIQNLFMAFKRVPMVVTLGQQYNVGEKPTVICTLIAMQEHQKNSKNKKETM